MKKGEIIEDVYYTMEKYSYLMADIDLSEDVYYTMEKYSYLMADIDLSMSMRWERSAAYIAGG